MEPEHLAVEMHARALVIAEGARWEAVGHEAHLFGRDMPGAGRREIPGNRSLEVRDAITPDALRAQGADAVALLRPADDRLLVLDPRFVKQAAATIVGAGETA